MHSQTLQCSDARIPASLWARVDFREFPARAAATLAVAVTLRRWAVPVEVAVAEGFVEAVGVEVAEVAEVAVAAAQGAAVPAEVAEAAGNAWQAAEASR